MRLSLLFSLILLFSACKKEGNDDIFNPRVSTSEEYFQDASLKVQAVYCVSQAGEICQPTGVSGANFELYESGLNMSQPSIALFTKIGNQTGQAFFDSLDAKSYSLRVDCIYGQKVLTIDIEPGELHEQVISF